MKTVKRLVVLYSLSILFVSPVVAGDSDSNSTENSCEQFTSSVLNMQQDQLNLVSESCQKAQKYPNDTVTKSASICSLAYLQKKYNALQADAVILLGLKKLNVDAIREYNTITARRGLKVTQAKIEAADLVLAVKRVNGFHNLLKDKAFKDLVRSTDPRDTIDIDAFCEKNPTSCNGINDLQSMNLVAGFATNYLKKMEATSPGKKSLDADFALFDKMLLTVPDNQVMIDLQNQISTLANGKLSEAEKQAELEKMQVNLAQMKASGFFEANDTTKERVKANLVEVEDKNPMQNMGNLIMMQMMLVQKKSLTTSAIEALMNDVDPTPVVSSDVVIDIKQFVQDNITDQYKTYHGQSLVNQNQTYGDNLLKNINGEISEIVDANGLMKDPKCPGSPSDYISIGSGDAICNTLYTKYIDLVKAREFAKVDKSYDGSVNAENDFKKQLIDLNCISEESASKSDFFVTERKAILSCLKEKSTNDKLDEKVAKNRKDMDDLNDQIQEIYKSKKYQSLDLVKNSGVQQYLNSNCSNKVEVKQQDYSQISCDNVQQTSSIDVFVGDNNDVIAQLDRNIQAEKNKKGNKRDNKKQQEELLAACADADVAARSGVICLVVNDKDKKLKSSEKVALDKNDRNYEFVNGEVQITQKKSAGSYVGAGVINAMGTALTSLRSYQQNMAVTGAYKQAAAYSAYAEYQQQNQLYWMPNAPQNFTSPYLYTGAPLGSINPYSTNFNYNNTSFYYNTTYDPLATIKNGTGGSGSNASWSGFNN